MSKGIFKEMDNLVNDFFGVIDKTLDVCGHGNHIMSNCSDCDYEEFNDYYNDEEITSEQEQSWHEQNIEEGWY